MEFSKPRMVALRVLYFLVSMGVLYMAKLEFGLSNLTFLVAAAVLLGAIIASYPLQLRLIRSVAYQEKQLGPQTMIGLEGRALEDLSPVGRIKVRGEIWRAASRSGMISKGETVVVVEVDGLTLTVERPNQRRTS